MTGRRPNLSDSRPAMGLKRNCTNEYDAMAIPIAASSTSNTFLANAGRIGIRIPKPSKSMNTVRKINVSADLLFIID